MRWPAENGTPVKEYWHVFTDLKRPSRLRATITSVSPGQSRTIPSAERLAS